MDGERAVANTVIFKYLKGCPVQMAYTASKGRNYEINISFKLKGENELFVYEMDCLRRW